MQENVSLAPYSTFGIGGAARYFIEIQKPDGVLAAVAWANERGLPYRVFAGGSNVIFPDEGVAGVLICLRGGSISFDGPGRIVADAGVALADVIAAALSRGLAGLETLSGIPGTIGGAVVGNAGAYGRSISEAVRQVEVFDLERQGAAVLAREACRFTYRHSVFKERPYLVLRAELELLPGDSDALVRRSAEIIALREKKYKPGLKCPGSFFKNVLVRDVGAETLSKIDTSKVIEGKIPAGYLLESVGAKGMREGGIFIADFHGNLFINDGTGTAVDVRRFAATLKARVRERFGIELEEEIRYF